MRASSPWLVGFYGCRCNETSTAPSDFVGASPGVLEVTRRARLAAGCKMAMLLLGETSAGKEVLAQAIHAASDRAGKSFIGVNVAAIPDNLLEAEFFGVAPGPSRCFISGAYAHLRSPPETSIWMYCRSFACNCWPLLWCSGLSPWQPSCPTKCMAGLEPRRFCFDTLRQ